MSFHKSSKLTYSFSRQFMISCCLKSLISHTDDLFFFSRTTYLHVISRHNHESPLWSSSLPPAWLLHPEHPSTNILAVSPLHMSKLSQTGHPKFVSKLSDQFCPSDVLILFIIVNTFNSASCLLISASPN